MAGTKNNISFCVGGTIPICLDLEHVQTGSRDSLTVMQKADSLGGLKLISCTQKRDCTLFRSDVNELEWWLLQGIMSSPFPRGLWQYSPALPVTTEADKGTKYLITPDDNVLALHLDKAPHEVSWLKYICEGDGFLSRRERLVIQLKESLASQISLLEQDLDPKDRGDEGRGDLHYDDDFVYVFTPAEDIAKTSTDDLVIKFNDWLDQNADRFPRGCLKRAGFALSMKPLSGRWGPAWGLYIPDQDTIAISPELLGYFLDGDDKELFSTVFHECVHNDFVDYGVRDEPAWMMADAFALAEAEMGNNKRTGRQISKATDRLKSEWQDWYNIGTELNAYMSEPVTDYIELHERLDHIALNYSDEAAIYVFNWLEESFISSPNLPPERFAEAMVMTEKYKSYVMLRPLIRSLDSMICDVAISPFQFDHKADGQHEYYLPLEMMAIHIAIDRSFVDKIFELPFRLFRRAQDEIMKAR